MKPKASSESTEEVPVKLFTVEPGGAQNVPLCTAYDEDIFVKPSDTRQVKTFCFGALLVPSEGGAPSATRVCASPWGWFLGRFGLNGMDFYFGL